MDPAFERSDVRVYLGDCREVMRTFADASVDAIVTDPPYELGFMGKRWDATGIAYDLDVWRECLRVLKPGGHLVAFGGTRTYHRMTCAIEDAGFEVRDCLAWMYGSGFPKSLDVSKAIDKAAGAEREVMGPSARHVSGKPNQRTAGLNGSSTFAETIGMGANITAPATAAARQWQGWGTALKPAFEPAVLARKPLVGTVAANVLEHGTGAINVDGCRVKSDDEIPVFESSKSDRFIDRNEVTIARTGEIRTNGRWPANVLLDEDAAKILDRAADEAPARFFYTAKASRSEREEGLREEGLRKEKESGSLKMRIDGSLDGKATAPRANIHPTVKPLDLMRYICRLVTPPGGIVFDPFSGSGSTLVAAYQEGFAAIGIEREEQYLEIIRGRVNNATKQQRLF